MAEWVGGEPIVGADELLSFTAAFMSYAPCIACIPAQESPMSPPSLRGTSSSKLGIFPKFLFLHGWLIHIIGSTCFHSLKSTTGRGLTWAGASR